VALAAEGAMICSHCGREVNWHQAKREGWLFSRVTPGTGERVPHCPACEKARRALSKAAHQAEQKTREAAAG